MKKQYHLSNGCSFSTKKKGAGSCHQILARLYGATDINLAKGGRGNDRMVQTTMQYFYNNPERFKDTSVSVGWSTPYRWDFILHTQLKEGSGSYVIRGANTEFDWQWQTWHIAIKDPPDPGNFFLKELPKAIPYVTSYYKKFWGFCLSYNEYLKLKKDRYKVEIETELTNGELLLGEAVIKGKSKKEIIL